MYAPLDTALSALNAYRFHLLDRDRHSAQSSIESQPTCAGGVHVDSMYTSGDTSNNPQFVMFFQLEVSESCDLKVVDLKVSVVFHVYSFSPFVA